MQRLADAAWSQFSGAPRLEERRAVLSAQPEDTKLDALLRRWQLGEVGQRVVVLLGAGASVAAGLPDFRDKQSGVYAKLKQRYGMAKPESVFDLDAFRREPGPVCTWMKEFVDSAMRAKPTSVHLFLKHLQERGSLLRCYTQNLDELELAAGLPREKLVMAHGTMQQPRCAVCNATVPRAVYEQELRAGEVPKCRALRCCGPIRPDIVFFEDSPNIPSTYQQDLDACDLLIVIGTSLQVQPFASLVSALPALVPRLIINRDQVRISNNRHLGRQLDYSEKGYRDVWLGGDCDEAARFLELELGWDGRTTDSHLADPVSGRSNVVTTGDWKNQPVTFSQSLRCTDSHLADPVSGWSKWRRHEMWSVVTTDGYWPSVGTDTSTGSDLCFRTESSLGGSDFGDEDEVKGRVIASASF